MRANWLSLGIAALGLIASGVAEAHRMRCGDRAQFVKKLETTHKEQRRIIAIINDNMVEVFVSKGGSWTMLTTNPSGLTCILADGTDWLELDQKLLEGKGI